MRRSLTTTVVEFAAASLPWAVRDRHRTEWLYALDHGPADGTSRATVTGRALRTALLADRMSVPSPAHGTVQATRRLRVGAVNVVLAAVWLVVLFGFSASWPLASGAGLVMLGHAAIGTLQLQLAARWLGGASRTAVGLVVVALLLGATGVVLVATLRPGGAWLALAAVGCGTVGLGLAEAAGTVLPRVVHPPDPPGRRRAIMIGTALGSGVLGFGVLGSTVLGPRLMVPGVPLAELWRQMQAVGEAYTTHAGAVGIGACLAGAPLLVALVATRWFSPTTRDAIRLLALGVLAGLTLTGMHAFGIGMSLGDTFPTTAGGANVITVACVLLWLVALEVIAWSRPAAAPLPPASVPLPDGPWHDPAARRQGPTWSASVT
ncbi:hypothetical protein [Microlunatus sp. Y2014]|uniref:hypothetical protein n=1 Tax=Microlunatus sp. Y2014 TaxID=3418488 RepID=UPI003DA76E4C